MYKWCIFYLVKEIWEIIVVGTYTELYTRRGYTHYDKQVTT